MLTTTKTKVIDWDLGVIASKQALHGKDIFRFVYHDEDGDWQFLDGSEQSADDVFVVSLKNVCEVDASLYHVVTMPRLHKASRLRKDQNWNEEPYTEEDSSSSGVQT